SQIETGRKNGSLKVMRDCAATLDVDLDDLV
ncbi:MAG: transcriptional regulator, partial [Proteobacteria bacterium]|nr:transcriptional regulator [Pseudomonadota bacterium]